MEYLRPVTRCQTPVGCLRSFAVRPDERRHSKLAIFGTDFARDASECMPGAGDK
jgi:hypothetical protein